jgi:hypothetical protein
MTNFIALETIGGNKLLLNVADISSVLDIGKQCNIRLRLALENDCFHVHGTAAEIMELINLVQRPH